MKTTTIPIDLTYFYSITEGNKEFGDTLLKSAIDDIHVHVAKLDQSWNAQDAAGVKQSAHSLISLSAIAGMPTVEKWCRHIENTFASAGFQPELAEPINSIVSGWPEASKELMAVIEPQMSIVN
jgi:HPt (histidine-containing phosphotransfer) domain-containing protein